MRSELVTASASTVPATSRVRDKLGVAVVASICPPVTLESHTGRPRATLRATRPGEVVRGEQQPRPGQRATGDFQVVRGGGWRERIEFDRATVDYARRGRVINSILVDHIPARKLDVSLSAHRCGGLDVVRSSDIPQCTVNVEGAATRAAGPTAVDGHRTARAIAQRAVVIDRNAVTEMRIARGRRWFRRPFCRVSPGLDVEAVAHVDAVEQDVGSSL